MSPLTHINTVVVFEGTAYRIDFDIDKSHLPEENKETQHDITQRVQALVLSHLIAQVQQKGKSFSPSYFKIDSQGAHFGQEVVYHETVNLPETLERASTFSSSYSDQLKDIFHETRKQRNESLKYLFVNPQTQNSTPLTAKDLWAFTVHNPEEYTTPSDPNMDLGAIDEEDSDDSDDEDDSKIQHLTQYRYNPPIIEEEDDVSPIESINISRKNRNNLEEDEKVEEEDVINLDTSKGFKSPEEALGAEDDVPSDDDNLP